jgi:hypothetical protein
MRLTRRTLSAALAALLIAAPAATARPHDYLAGSAAAASTQDLRSPDARDAEQRAAAPTTRNAIEMRRRHGYTPGSAPAQSTSHVPAGQPTWPTNPTTLAAPPAQQPSTDGDAWPLPVLPIVGFAFVVIIAAVGARHGVRRAHRRPRVAA